MIQKIVHFIGLLLIVTTLISANQDDVNTSKELSFFGDDGSLDLGEYMSQTYGFLPVPILITEPAVGYGGGVALVYLHDKLTGTKTASGRRIPPSMSGVILAATQNGTQIGGAFHKGYWLEDKLRTMSYIGLPNIYMDMYAPNSSFELNIKGEMAYQDAKFRLGESDIFLGLAYLYVHSDISIDFARLEQDFGGAVDIASLAFMGEYDTRDNQFSPNKGMLLNAKVNKYDEKVGGDYSFTNYKLITLFYNPLSSKVNLDFNFVAEHSAGDDTEIPPYLYPFISMRGLPMMKYQGTSIATAQTQLSYKITPRWTTLVFGGIGRAFDKQIVAPSRNFNDAPDIIAGGIGFRYLIASKFGLRMGIDIAKSEEDEAFYIQFGTAWHGF